MPNRSDRRAASRPRRLKRSTSYSHRDRTAADPSRHTVALESWKFLGTDVFSVSAGNCVSFLKPLLESWNIDLSTFGMEIVLNHTLVPGHLKKLDFVEREFGDPVEDEPGLTEFLQDTALSGNASRDEIAFLRRLAFKGKRPSPLYYYRELQNLRDPMHFRATVTPR